MILTNSPNTLSPNNNTVITVLKIIMQLFMCTCSCFPRPHTGKFWHGAKWEESRTALVAINLIGLIVIVVVVVQIPMEANFLLH